MPLRIANGKWHYRFQVGGQVYRGSTGLAATERNRAKALSVEAQHREAVTNGREWKPRPVLISFEDAADEFYEWAKREHSAHPSTHLRLRSSFASLRELLGAKSVASITAGDLEQYKTWRRRCPNCTGHQPAQAECDACEGTGDGVRPVTLRHDLHALSKFYRYALKRNWASGNPVTLIEIPSDADAMRDFVLSVAGEKLYFSHASGGLYDLGRLVLLQGLRPGEALALEKSAVNLDAGRIRIDRGKSRATRRTLTLTEESKIVLARRMGSPSHLVFPLKSWPYEEHEDVLRRTGLSFVPYTFRHTFATRLAESNIDLATLAAILGHSSLRSVMRYVHPTAEHQAEAMRKFDAIMQTRQE